MKRRTLIPVVTVSLLTVGLMLGASPAYAAEATPPPTVATATVHMTSGGFRADVAKANGYQIVTNPDGSESSVPVTKEAIAQQAAADAAKASRQSQASAGVASPQGSPVDGDCGSSWIQAVKQDNNVLAYTTGYVVFGAVVDSQWKVVADAVLVGNSVTLHPGANSGTWSTEGALGNVVGPGFATADPFSSFAILASGQVCYSGGPSASFG